MAESIDSIEALRAHARVHASRASLGDAPRKRVVSLVPSLSEALHVLGLGDRLVGVTDYCVHPAGAFEAIEKVGGTKDADVEAIAATTPDLVIANEEENTARVVRKLAERGFDVWVTYPRTVREGAVLLDELAALGASDAARMAHVVPSLEAVARAEAAVPPTRPRVFCPIWRDPWMTIGGDTYIDDMITLCGGRNLFADPEAAPVRGRGDRRYPKVDLETVVALDPEVILLPDEPYAFAESDRAALLATDCAAARAGRVHLIDGTLVSWYGPRIAEAIQVLARLFCD
ncbi:MAG: helical backbone metal receptor [Myxococcota bacterium]